MATLLFSPMLPQTAKAPPKGGAFAAKLAQK
jgi:hypothetical protein